MKCLVLCGVLSAAPLYAAGTPQHVPAPAGTAESLSEQQRRLALYQSQLCHRGAKALQDAAMGFLKGDSDVDPSSPAFAAGQEFTLRVASLREIAVQTGRVSVGLDDILFRAMEKNGVDNPTGFRRSIDELQTFLRGPGAGLKLEPGDVRNQILALKLGADATRSQLSTALALIRGARPIGSARREALRASLAIVPTDVRKDVRHPNALTLDFRWPDRGAHDEATIIGNLATLQVTKISLKLSGSEPPVRFSTDDLCGLRLP